MDPKNENFDLEESMSKSLKILETYLSNFCFEELGLKSMVIEALDAIEEKASEVNWSEEEKSAALIEEASRLLLNNLTELEPEELVMTYKKYLTKKIFFHNLVEKMVVVDPLDRPIIGSEENGDN